MNEAIKFAEYCILVYCSFERQQKHLCMTSHILVYYPPSHIQDASTRGVFTGEGPPSRRKACPCILHGQKDKIQET